MRRRKDLNHLINQICGLFACHTICKITLSCLVLLQSLYCFVDVFSNSMSKHSATEVHDLGFMNTSLSNARMFNLQKTQAFKTVSTLSSLSACHIFRLIPS